MGLFDKVPPMTPKPLRSTVGAVTPPAVKVRLEILEQQNETLINEKGMLTRKHKGDVSNLEGRIATLQQQYKESQELLSRQQHDFRRQEDRLRAVEQASNAGWQQEKQTLATQVKLAERTARLAAAENDVKLVELERRLVQAEKQRLKQAHTSDRIAAAKADLQMQLEEQASRARVAEAEHAANARSLAALRQRHRSTLEGLQEKEATQAEASRQLNTQSSEHTALLARYKALKVANERDVASLAETKESLEQVEQELEQTKATVEDQRKGRDKLQKTISMWKERCEEKQKELDAWLREEKNEAGTEKELRSLKSDLRNVKAELVVKTDEVTELTAEQDRLRQQIREREKEVRELRRAEKDLGAGVNVNNAEAEEEIAGLKKTLESKEKDIRKLGRAVESRDEKIAKLEDEVSKAKAKASKAAPVAAAKPSKASFTVADIPADEASDEEIPSTQPAVAQAASQKEKPVVEAPTKKRKAEAAAKPLAESNRLPAASKPKTDKNELKRLNEIFVKPVKESAAPLSDGEGDAPVEKKKKRKLGMAGAKTAFVWDQAKNPEGPIPLYLSPLKKSTVPRAGFGAGAKTLYSRF